VGVSRAAHLLIANVFLGRVFNPPSDARQAALVQSIFNPYSQFGSRYSAYSACNPYATDPPVIVDENGNYYGRLTVNTYYGDGTRDGRLQRAQGVHPADAEQEVARPMNTQIAQHPCPKCRAPLALVTETYPVTRRSKPTGEIPQVHGERSFDPGGVTYPVTGVIYH